MRPTAIRLRPGEFFGGIERHLDVQDLLLRETRHAASQLIPRHEHEAPHFCLGIEGACRERIHRRDVDCVPGTIEYHPGGTTHASRWEAGGGRCFTVTLGRDWATRMIAEDREIAPRPGLLGREARELMLRLHRELRAPDPASPAVVDGLTLALVAVAGRDSVGARRAAPPAWLARAEDYLRAHAFGEVRAGDAAAAAGVHPVLLSRWFQRVHGMTVGEFVRHLRVGRAARLLVTTAQPITRIALDCGFVDHAHLARTFRRSMHVTPSEYRRLHRGG